MMKKITINTRIKATHFRLLLLQLPVMEVFQQTLILIIIQGLQFDDFFYFLEFFWGEIFNFTDFFRHQEDSSSGGVMFDSGMMTVTKTEVESPHPVFPNHCSVMTNYGSTPDPSESFNISSDVEGSTCPETPDSSVKEEADVNSPDTGSYVW